MSMSRSNDRPWNSESEHSSNTDEASEDRNQLLINALLEEVKTLKRIIKLLFEKDKMDIVKKKKNQLHFLFF